MKNPILCVMTLTGDFCNALLWIFIFCLCSISPITINAQIITTVAGVGTQSGYSGDAGPATNARLNNPDAVAIDGLGNIYIAEYTNHCIRKVTAATGIITTVAGTGQAGYSGDGGPATSAMLNYPTCIALDGSANIYIADYHNDCIRKVSALTGIISTVAGMPQSAGYSGDGGPAAGAKLYLPSSLTFDGSGNMYIADFGNNCVRKVSAVSGIISTIAGVGQIYGYSGDGGPAISAKMDGPRWIKLDDAGNLYIADYNNFRIRKVIASSGVISTIAGTGTSGYSGDGSAATSAQISYPTSVALDRTGNLYIADYYNYCIRRVTATTGIISTIAGIPQASGFSGDGGPPTGAKFNSVVDIAFDGSGNIFIADRNNHCIRKITNATAFVPVNKGGEYFRISPMPATTSLTIETNDTRLGMASITDLQGRVVMQFAIKSVLTINMTPLPAGIYLLRINDGHSYKIIKQ